MVYLACHGGRLTRGGKKTKGSYLYCKDTVFGKKSEVAESSISMNEFAEMLSCIKGKHRTVFLDVCHSKKPRSSVCMCNVFSKNAELLSDLGFEFRCRWKIKLSKISSLDYPSLANIEFGLFDFSSHAYTGGNVEYSDPCIFHNVICVQCCLSFERFQSI